MNPLVELAKTGQSVWFDQMERKLLTTGKLKQLIDEDDLRGLTSNPTIFEKAIGGSEDYDAQLRTLASQGKSRDEIYDELVAEDIGNAADVFAPVYDKTKGDDGYASLEVSPLLANDTAHTVSEAKRLFTKVARPNVMIKIPATPEGIPAIEQAIALGININVTLIFSNDVYAQVIEAYLRGLEKRASQGLPIGHIASVASFFVSRIDAQADKQLEAKGITDLQGKVAIANAKMAYQLFKKIFTSERFQKLRDKGARVQRPLWASTGTKNPKYRDVLYIESLIGPDTVNTIPPATYDAFKDHGEVEMTIEQDIDEARRVLEEFEAKGFSLKAITDKLTAEGVKSFNESFEQLMMTIEARRDAVVRGLPDRVTLHGLDVDDAIARAEKEKFVTRIHAKDSSLWKSDDAHRKLIDNALGWLPVIEMMHRNAKGILELTEELREGFDHVVVLGMGGSSLCSEVVRRLFGKRDGYPELLVLDSTVPEAVRMLEAKIDVAKTLFIVASKSGTTTEPAMFHRYFYDRVKQAKGGKAGENFVAVTDPDTKLVEDAQRDTFRRIFVNPADIGGRYSALSFFGLVPMALAGVDIATLLERALHAVARLHAARRSARTRPRFSARRSVALHCRAATSSRSSRRARSIPSDSGSSSWSRRARGRKGRGSSRSRASRLWRRTSTATTACSLPYACGEAMKQRACVSSRPRGIPSSTSSSKTRSTWARHSSSSSSRPRSPARSSASIHSISRTCRSRRTTPKPCSRSSRRRGR